MISIIPTSVISGYIFNFFQKVRFFYYCIYLYINKNIMKRIIRLTESDLTRIIKRTIIEMEEDDDEVIVNVNDIAKEDMACFNDVATPSGMNGGKYKRKKKGCQTKTRYKSKTKYYGNNRF